MPLSTTLGGILAPGPLCYREYAAGCEVADEPSTEPTLGLAATFDHVFAPALLCCALRELDPPVQLLTVDEPNGSQRRDWPWLSDEHLDALEAHCRLLLGNPLPCAELTQLLRVLRLPLPLAVPMALPLALTGTPRKPLAPLGFFGNPPAAN